MGVGQASVTSAVKAESSPRPRALFSLFPKQQYALDLIFGEGYGEVGGQLTEGVDQLLFGGSAGGGKSGFVRAFACYVANIWPGSEFAIFRRTNTELHANHVGKWLAEIDPYVKGGVWMAQAMEYRWPSPPWCWCPKGAPCPHSSKTPFLHVDFDRGATKHQGAEHAGQGIDEATHFDGDDIDYLYTRVRTTEGQQFARDVIGPDGKVYHHPGWPGWRPIQLLTANPGGRGHQYMLDTYIDPVGGLLRAEESEMKEILVEPQQLTDVEGRASWTTDIIDLMGEVRALDVDLVNCKAWTVEVDLGPLGKVPIRRAFVQARVQDNPALDLVKYAAGLAVGSAEQRRRLLDGDWTYFSGQVFSVLNVETHQVDTRRIFGRGYTVPPHDWPRTIGLDHGSSTANPSAAEWITRDPEGFFIVYMEYYAVGPPAVHIPVIKDLMMRDGHPEIRPVMDPQMQRATKGHTHMYSVADEYEWNGPPPEDRRGERQGIKLVRKYVERETGRLQLLRLLEPDPDRMFPEWHLRAGEPGSPGIFIAQQCTNLWRELPGIRYKEGATDDTEKVNDHAYDALWHALPPFERECARPRGLRPVIILESRS